MTQIVVRDYAAHQFAIEAKSQGNMRIREVSQYTFTVPTPVPVGPVLPSWVTHAWEADSLAGAIGDPITTWTDQVAAVAVTQTTPSQRGLIAEVGGYRAVHYDGVDDRHVGSLTFGQQWSMFAVFQLISGGGTVQSIVDSDSGSSRLAQFLRRNTANRLETIAFNTAVTAFTASNLIASETTKQIAGSTARIAAGGLIVYDQSDTGTPASPTGTMASGARSIAFGGRIPIGTQYAKMYLHAVYAVVDTAITPAQVTELYAYSTAKWGTP